MTAPTGPAYRRIRVRTAGDVHGGEVFVGTGCSACGQIRGGVSISMGDDAGFVASWPDFEAAYLAAKAYRETAGFRLALAEQIEELGPGLGEWPIQVDPSTGHMHQGFTEAQANQHGLVPIPDAELPAIQKMNRYERREWAAEQRRSNKVPK